MKMWLSMGMGLALCLALAGCEDDEFDHTPPSGQGSLIVDNHTADDIDLFVNGAWVTRVDGGDEAVVDLEPGLYRIVLNDEDDLRSFRDDVDVLEGRLTVLDVTLDGVSLGAYRVLLYFD